MNRQNTIQNTLLAFAFALLAVLGAAAPALAATDLTITTGLQSFVRTDAPVVRASVGDSEIAEVIAVNKYEVRLLAKKPGRTDLAIWLKDAGSEKGERRITYRVQVSADLSGLRRMLERDPVMKGVILLADGQRVVLDGEVPSEAASTRLTKLADLYIGKEGYANLTRLAGKKMVSVEIKFAAVSTQTLRALGFSFEKLGSKFIGAAYSPNTLTNGLLVSDNGVLGLEYDRSIPVSEAFNLAFGSFADSFLTILSALNSTNLAQILASPTLQVRSGEEASFIAGGEIPIPVPQGGGQTGSITIDYREFGVKLKIAPTVLDDERIILDVEPEVSDLEFSNALQLQGFTVPAISKRGTKTSVELRDGQSFVLAGLVQNSTSNIEEKVPYIGNIPILGMFFKRVRTQRDLEELIIVATPRLVDANDMPAPQQLPGEEVQDYEPSINDILLDRNELDRRLAEHGLLP